MFWLNRGYVSEGRGWLERVHNSAANTSPSVRSKALSGAGVLATYREVWRERGLASLLAGDVKIDSIELAKPQVELIRNKAGVWNFSSLKSGDKPATAEAETAPSPASKSNFSLRRLAITGGSIAITDTFRDKPRTVYGPIDITLLDYPAGQPFGFDVAARLPGGGSQSIQLKGTGGPLPESGPAALPLKATVSLNDVDLAGLRRVCANRIDVCAVSNPLSFKHRLVCRRCCHNEIRIANSDLVRAYRFNRECDFILHLAH